MNEGEWHRLWSKLEQKLGVEEAATLMELLPRWSEERSHEPATPASFGRKAKVEPPGMTSEQLQQAIKDDTWFAVKLLAITHAYLIWMLVVVPALAR